MRPKGWRFPLAKQNLVTENEPQGHGKMVFLRFVAVYER